MASRASWLSSEGRCHRHLGVRSCGWQLPHLLRLPTILPSIGQPFSVGGQKTDCGADSGARPSDRLAAIEMGNPMSEPIRYSFGKRSLDDFIAAVSGAGLVTFEFGEDQSDLLKLPLARFSDADVERDDASLRDTVDKLERLVEHPDQDPGIALDPRGDAYPKQVWTLLREIPAGETTTYGAVAAKVPGQQRRLSCRSANARVGSGPCRNRAG